MGETIVSIDECHRAEAHCLWTLFYADRLK